VLQTRDLAAQLASADAVTIATTSKQAVHWRNYLSFLGDVELDGDPFLTALQAWQRQGIISAFASAYCDGRFSPKHDPSSGPAVMSGSVRAAIDTVDPITARLAYVLQRQLKGYTNQDPTKKPQKAVTPRVIHALTAINSTLLDEAVNELVRGAFFFAMRSCEYLRVPASEQRRTKLLRLQNLRFFRARVLLLHDDPTLHLADSVSINFEFQKNDERDAIITMHHTGDSILCPVIT
jgi:hypothetical protein